MADLRRLTLGIVLTRTAERQLTAAPPVVADQLRSELVHLASLEVRREVGPPSETPRPERFQLAGYAVDYTIDHRAGTLIAHSVLPLGRLAEEPPPVLRILLVDDDRFALTLLGDRLRQLGHQVVSVDSAEAALREDFDLYDAVVCDFIMPGVNGAQLLRQVREDRRSKVRFIFVTATRQPEELVREAIRHDADFLPKPVDLDYLVEMIADGRRRTVVDHALALAGAASVPLPP